MSLYSHERFSRNHALPNSLHRIKPLLEGLKVAELIKKFSAVYETPIFVIFFTISGSCHFLEGRLTHSTSLHPISLTYVSVLLSRVSAS